MKIQNFCLIFFLLFAICSPVLAENVIVNDINQAISLVIENNPDLEAQRYRLSGKQALIAQANSLPNPELNLGTENFSGSNSDLGLTDNGFNQRQNTVSISQKIELGGKRDARKNFAENQRSLEKAKTELKFANLLKDLEVAYAGVVLSQKLVKLTEEQKTFSENVLKLVKERVNYGGILAGEETKAEIALQLISIDIQKAHNELEQNKRILAALWNGSISDIGELSDKSEPVLKLEIPSIENFLVIKAQGKEIDIAKSALAQEKAEAIPDLTFSGGYRRFEDSGTDAFVANISVPLPIFNRNQGKVKEASNELIASKLDYQQTKTHIESQLSNLIGLREVLIKERMVITKQLLPSSNLALSQIREAYQLGRIGYLDLIDSRRAFFDTRIREAENLYALKLNEVTITSSSGQILDKTEVSNKSIKGENNE